MKTSSITGAGVLLCLALGACTTTTSPSPTAPTQPVAASPSTAVVKITAVPPEKPTGATIVLDDPALVRAVPDNQPYGPTTFFVDGDTTTVYDVLTNKLVTYRNGKRNRAIPFPQYVCLDLIIRNDHYWALVRHQDFTYAVIDYQLTSTNTLTKVREYPAEGEHPIWLTSEGGNIILQTLARQIYLIAGPGSAQPSPKYATEEHGFRIQDGSNTITIATQRTPVSIQLLTRTDRYDYYWVAVRSPHNWGFVYQLTKTGELTQTYTLLPMGDLDPTKPIQIGPDGQVYEMVITDKTTRIYRVAPNS